ncbi:MAG: biopolymer transporter ExbD [Treponema sp.]|nr:biopolymer transporter ExbD [Treponema sp.]
MKIKRRRRLQFFNPNFFMSDLAFELLIFIMLVSLINYRKEVKIDYPVADTNQRINAEKNLEIWIDIAGNVYLDGNPANLSDVENKISELYRTAPDTRVHILADRNTPYGKINNVLEIMQVLQYRAVSFVVKNEK